MTSHANQNRQIGWPQAFRDILIASMNRGQFPLAMVSCIVIVLIQKMPPEDVSILAASIMANLENGRLFGYFLSFMLAGGWFFHSKWQRRMLDSEIDRMSNERNKVQTQKLGKKLKSSKDIS
jgi:hypothetical protein